jgi:hypothetical protein
MNPLFSNWTNYPYGVNLGQNNEMLLLGILTAPLTVLVSPVASYTLLIWLAFPISAGSMFLVLRRWTGSDLASFIGGLLYGFSAYEIGQGEGHVMLTFVPLLPVFLYQIHKIVVRQDGSPYRQGLVLGLIAIAQAFISADTLAMLIVLTIMGIAILAIANWRSIQRETVTYAGRGLALAGILFAVIMAYPVRFALAGPQHFTGPIRSPNNPYQVPLLGPLVPSNFFRYIPHFLAKYANYNTGVETQSYIGVPLLLLALILVVRFRHNRWLPFTALMASIAYVFSLGYRLDTLTHRTSIPGPYVLLTRIPLLVDIVAGRISLFIALFFSITVALGFAELIKYLRDGGRRPYRHHTRNRLPAGRVLLPVVVGLGVLAGISLVPRWPYRAVPSNIPVFFRSSLAERIPINSVVLTYPYVQFPDDQAMMWQATSGMRFKTVGTYALSRGANGGPSVWPRLLQPAGVQAFLTSQAAQEVTPSIVEELRQYLAAYRISTVIEDLNLPNIAAGQAVGHAAAGPTLSAQAMELFDQTLGPPEMVGGVAAWFDVPARIGVVRSS